MTGYIITGLICGCLGTFFGFVVGGIFAAQHEIEAYEAGAQR